MKDETAETHESYGMVGISRWSIGPPGMNLFGSSIRHSSAICLTVRRASKERTLNQEWIHGGDEIVKIFLSPSQFTEMITSPNVGFGVPCTIRHVQGQAVGSCPETQQRQLFEAEFKADIQEVMRDANQIVCDVTALMGRPTIKKAEREAVIEKLRMLAQHINSNMPFVQTQFNEALDKTTTEAKAEVEAFIETKIRSLGIEGLTDMVKQLSAPIESAPFQLSRGERGAEEGT